jgi:elongator complex protein 4
MSTGTATLDHLLSMQSGLSLSSALLVEEEGTGNYSGVILRQYVAEGVIQGDKIWIGGMGTHWWRGVPAQSSKSKKSTNPVDQLQDKMKIAWRYESNSKTDATAINHDFCHSFDISEQCIFPEKGQVCFAPLSSQGDVFPPLLSSLQAFLKNGSPNECYRLVLPDFLNPLLYPPQSTNPATLLKFLHTMLSILHSSKYITLLISLSTSFYPRSTSLTSWIEHLCTHVLQLSPLPRNPSIAKQPQGLVHVYKGGLMMKEMGYRVGRGGMVLEEWSLPPLEEETPRVKQGFVIEKEVVKGTSLVSGLAKKDLEF